MKLEALVAKYRAEDATRLQQRLEYFHGLKSFSTVIEDAALAKEPEWSEYRKHPHQWRLQEAKLKEVAGKLLRQADKLRACRSFEEVFHIVDLARVPRFGDLAVYDTALRIAAKLAQLPLKVYLHAGTREGCKALALPFREKTLEPKLFQRPIQQLQAHEIEDFVCIYKDLLASDHTPDAKSGSRCSAAAVRRRRSTRC